MVNKLEKIFGWCYDFLIKINFSEDLASYFSLVFNGLLLYGIAYLIYIGFRLVLVTILALIAKKTKTNFDDLLVSNKTAKYISHLMPFLFIYKSVPIILEDFVYWESMFGKLVGVYIILLIIWILRSILKALRDYIKSKPKFKDKPIDSYVQVILILMWIFGSIFIISKLFDVKPSTLYGTLGAVSAVIILIFRDTILGFVASVQVSLNDMVRIGDWVTFDKFGADGHIIEINLATVKVRNFDNTTTTIPTYSLISDSFRNWRGMHETNGRRIKRHLLIDPKSIRFLTESDLNALNRIQLLSPYISNIQADINLFNSKHNIDKSIAINGRNLTNFGLFRKYITNYLKQHPGINKDMVLVCRQLQATSQGAIPLEIYAFSNDKRFEQYEYIMSDIFDHVYASIKYFDLTFFE
ncbi:MAG: mechanosensitive ion channel [Flavobacterium sp.]|nr:mechanosensitive ion channel [Flavobacterium sp.]